MNKCSLCPLKCLILIALASGLSSGDAFAATINATDPSAAAVQNAVNIASNGDTVIVPAGSATWTVKVTVNKPISLVGAGIDVTRITRGLTNSAILDFAPTNLTIPANLSGFTFIDSSSGYNFGLVRVGGTKTRVHHCKFSGITGSGAMNWGDGGLIDHCTFISGTGSATGVMMSGGGTDNWNTTVAFGTADFFFIEDCTFTTDHVDNGAIDAFNSAKYVFRHNTVTNNYVGHHGCDSGNYRSTYACEIYNNAFTINRNWPYCMQSRGGAGLFHNNTCDSNGGSYTSTVALEAFRSRPDLFPPGFFGGWGECSGSNPNDGNTEATGYPCLDQPGRTGPTAFLQDHSTQVLSPVYAWNNTKNGVSAGVSPTNYGNVIRENRDYYNSSKPGYTPYTYPHPLTGASPGAPNSPTNLRVQ